MRIRGVRPRSRRSAAPLGVTWNSRTLRDTSHQRQARPTGTRKIRNANAVGQWISLRMSCLEPQSRTVNMTRKTPVKSSGPAVEVWAPESMINTGIRKATNVAMPSSHQSVPFRYSW